MDLISGGHLNEAASMADACEDPVAMGSAFHSAVKAFYRERKDVTNMLVAGEMGVAYCRRMAVPEPDAEQKTRELRKLARVIAFNTAVNCWPGWGDAGIVIEERHIRAGLELAAQCRELSQELALSPREQGGAHWLTGALELALGRLKIARAAFEEAERVYVAGELTAYALMARGYIALTGKDAGALNGALNRLRLEGSKDAIFFADQIATADRLLFAARVSGPAAEGD